MDFMLNIDDVRQRLEDYPEPSWVADIRHNIIDAFADMEFQEIPHRYILHREDGDVTLPSVSSFIHRFEPKVDWDSKAAGVAERTGRRTEDVVREWHENNLCSTNNGTLTHLYGENFNYFMRGKTHLFSPVIAPQYEEGYLIPYSGKQVAAMRYYENLHAHYYNDNITSKIYPVMVEAKTYSGKTQRYSFRENYSGTFDILHAFMGSDGVPSLIIDDFKTNKEIYKDFSHRTGQRLHEPFSEYYVEPYSSYTIQLSMYALNIMQLGYRVVRRRIIWLKDDGTYDTIPLNDVTDRIIEYLS